LLQSSKSHFNDVRFITLGAKQDQSDEKRLNKKSVGRHATLYSFHHLSFCLLEILTSLLKVHMKVFPLLCLMTIHAGILSDPYVNGIPAAPSETGLL
jgi:hypothetical protein